MPGVSFKTTSMHSSARRSAGDASFPKAVTGTIIAAMTHIVGLSREIIFPVASFEATAQKLLDICIIALRVLLHVAFDLSQQKLRPTL